MSRRFRLLLSVALMAALLPVSPAAAQSPQVPIPHCLPFEVDPLTHEQYLICLPADRPWNGDLVLFAHGYVAPNEPMSKYLEQLALPDGTTIPGIANTLGYAFASTSYRKNGLAVKEGVQDVDRLLAFFEQHVGPAGRVYLIGASEGGLVTALAVEQKPDRFDGGLALCGPIGNFRSQINYWTDFRVLFDYFFPAHAIPNSAVDINEALVWPNWPALSQAIGGAVLSNPTVSAQLLRTSGAPIDPANPATVAETTVGILSYNVFATNEGKLELGGQPFDNSRRLYVGSSNDWRLNRQVARFTADPAALIEINANYQTSGRLTSPLVTMHTTGDPIVPYWHETMYTAKTLLTGSFFKHTNIPIVRYGHCNFTSTEALVGFVVLVLRTGAAAPDGVDKLLPDTTRRAEYDRLLKQYAPIDSEVVR